MARIGKAVKRTPTILAAVLFCAICVPPFTRCALAQAPSDLSQATAEPSTQAKIAQLEAAKKGLARQARETNGYHESLRQMKIVKIDDLIARLKRGENVPQRKIDKTIGHMSFPLYEPPGG